MNCLFSCDNADLSGKLFDGAVSAGEIGFVCTTRPQSTRCSYPTVRVRRNERCFQRVELSETAISTFACLPSPHTPPTFHDIMVAFRACSVVSYHQLHIITVGLITMSAHLPESRTSPRIMLDGECTRVTRVSVIWECARTTRREFNGCKSERHHPFSIVCSVRSSESRTTQLHDGGGKGGRDCEGLEKGVDLRCDVNCDGFWLQGLSHGRCFFNQLYLC